MTNANKMPRPIRISRKLELSSEKLAVMGQDPTIQPPPRCTLWKTGCGPIHTC
jgi:hypothetical protein